MGLSSTDAPYPGFSASVASLATYSQDYTSTHSSPTYLWFCWVFVWISIKLCDKTLPGKMQHTHLLTPDREPTTDQSTDTTKVQLGEPVSFVGSLTGPWQPHPVLVRAHGSYTMCRQRHQRITTSPSTIIPECGHWRQESQEERGSHASEREKPSSHVRSRNWPLL